MIGWIACLSLGAATAVSGQQATAQQAPTPQTEDVTEVEDVVVVTASRREEMLLNAPATVSVISDETIGAAPGQTLPDLLRAIPGINVAQTSARDVNVNSRSATGTLSDSLLVLLDGRSIYQDFFGFVVWDFLPVDTSEIKQIEVIRGPASAVWGANAMTGVVNVISKTPREMQGTTIGFRFGQFDRSPGEGRFEGGGLLALNATHARAPSDRFAYKVSAGMFLQEPLLRPAGFLPGTQTRYPAFVNEGTRQPRLDVRADYDLADGRRKLVIETGIAGTEGIIHGGLGPLAIERGSAFTYGRLLFTRDKLKVQMFVNAVDAVTSALLQRDEAGRPLDISIASQAYDVEFSNAHVHSRHIVSYGGNYRHNSFDMSVAARADSRDETGAYVQDEVFLSDRYRWVVGVRIDRFDVLHKAVVSPRTAFLIKPATRQTIRLSINRAFRAPSFVNTFFDTRLLNEADLGTADRFEFVSAVVGNKELKEEGLTAYEAGYIGRYGRSTLGANVYVSHFKNMIQFTETQLYTSARPPVGWPLPVAVLDQLASAGQGLPARFTYLNFKGIVDKGLELSIEQRLPGGVAALANYSWQARPKQSGFDAAEMNVPPAYRVNIGVNGVYGRYFGGVFTSYVGRAFWQDVLAAPYHGWSPAYKALDGGIGMRSRDGVTVAFRGTNLLNASIQQHVFGDVIKRTFTGEVRFFF
jgi:iron complex outermembrane receptor protein